MRRLLTLGLALALTGCAFIFGATDVRRLELLRRLPDSLGASVHTHDRAVAYRFIPFENGEEMYVKAASGDFYEFDFQAALDSLCADLLQRKFSAVSDTATDTIIVTVLETSKKIEPINPHLSDFHCKLGIIVELRAGAAGKSIARHDETTVHTPREAEDALTAMVNGLLLEVALEIDKSLDEMMIE